MPTPKGKATDMPAREMDAERRMFEALNITPPKITQPMLSPDACPRSSRNERPVSPWLPIVKPSKMVNNTIPIT